MAATTGAGVPDDREIDPQGDRLDGPDRRSVRRRDRHRPPFGQRYEPGPANALRYIEQNEQWMLLPPGLAISLTVLGFNLLGDGLRDALDPRLLSR